MKLIANTYIYSIQYTETGVVFQYYGIPQHFGLFYAMGGSLIMEGLLSGCYHICPNNANYQFGELSVFLYFDVNTSSDLVYSRYSCNCVLLDLRRVLDK